MKFAALNTKVAEILVDESKVNWTNDQINAWLVEGELVIIQKRPDASATGNIPFPLVAGAKQSIPSDGFALLSIIQNENGRSIRLISDRSIKDELDPGWMVSPASSVVREYVFDEKNPTEFFVSPPSVGGVNVVGSYSQKPPTYDFGTDPDITVDERYAPAMVDFAVYRCLSRSDENSPEYAKGMAFLQSFTAQVGDKTQADLAFSPNAAGARA